jgi:phosphoserine phosphatase
MPNKNPPAFTGLILVSGEDRPGITQSLMKVLSQFSVNVIDVEQLIIRDRLLLTVLITLDESHAEAVAADLSILQEEIGLDIAIDFVHHEQNNENSELLNVVIIGESIKPIGLAAVADEIARLGGNIIAIRRTATTPVLAIELNIEIPNKSIKEVQRSLAKVAITNRIDLAVEPSSRAREAKRLVLLDMDSTLIQQEVIDLLAKHAGKLDQVSQITERAMAGDLDFSQALSARVALLAGLDQSVIELVRKEITLTNGAKELIETLHKQGHKVGVVSGGFLDVIEPILKDLKIDFYRANKLEIMNGKLTGKTEGAIIDRVAKFSSLQEFAKIEGVELSQTVAIGDGANDLDMIEAAGLGIAFNAKPKVAAAAATTISTSDLSTVLLLMGIQTSL